MAEVGILNLTIQDNSDATSQGLANLADALTRVKRAVSGSKTGEFASALKRIQKAIDDGANSYRTLGRLATSIEKVKQSLTGFRIPDFKNLIDLARALQENYNAETNLNKLAAAMEAIKQASVGFKMPNARDMDKLVSVMNGMTGNGNGGTGTGMEKTAETLEQVQSRVESINENFGSANTELANLTGWTAGGDATQFFNAFEGMNTDRMQMSLGDGSHEAGDFSYLKQEAIEVEGVVSKAYDTIAGHALTAGDAFTEAGSAMNAIIPYGKNLEDSWQHLCEVAEEGKRAWTEAMQRWRESKPEGWGTGGIRELYASTTGFGPALRGENGSAARREAAETISQGTGLSINNIYQQIAELSEKARESREQIDSLMDALNKPIDWGNMSQGIDRMQGIGAAAKSAEDSARAFLEGMGGSSAQAQQLRELNPEWLDLKQKMDEAGVSAKDFTGKMVDVDGELKAKKKDAEGAKKGFLGLKETFQQLIKEFKTTAIGKLGSEFLRLAKRMAIRAIIKQVSGAFKEGVENVYWYNKAIGGSFADSMDSAATSLLQMKNAIGAAVAPAIQMLIPYVQQLVSGFINVVNYINQFLALINGQSQWTRAIEYQTQAYEDNTKKSKSAQKAAKDLLADWDELNIIQSNSSGGSGPTGKTSPDYSKMFEQVNEFDNEVVKVFDYIKTAAEFILDHFVDILALVNLIKLGIKATKFSSAFAGVVGDLLGIAATGIIMKLVVDATSKLDKKFLETGDEGWLLLSLLTPVIGGFFAQKVLKNVMGGKLTKLAIPLALTLSAITDIVVLAGDTNTTALSKESLELSATSALKTGAAAAFLAYNTMGKSLGKSLAGGAAIAIATFGVVVGIKAVAQAAKGGVTEETLKSAALSSVAIGIGAGLFAKIVGVSTLGAIGFGAAAAALTVATLAVAIGITAMLTASKDTINWGTYVATQEQIKEFIEEKGFNIPIKATLELIDSKINLLPQERKKLEINAAGLVPTLKVIRYGLATESTYNKLKEDLFGADGNGGVVGDIKQYAEKQKTLIETSFTLIPIVDEKGNTDDAVTKKFMEAGISGWSEVENYMGQIGTRLADALKGSTKDGITTFDDELILELTEKLNNVQRAIATATVSSDTVGTMMTSLTGVTKDNYDYAVTVWDDYKNQLKAKYAATLQEELTSFRALEAFYLTRGEKGDAALAKKYGDMADELEAMWEDRLNSAVEESAANGKELFKNAILEMMTVHVTDDDVKSALADSGFENYAMSDFVASMFDTKGNINSTATERFTKYLNDILSQTFGVNYESIKSLIDKGALSYGDLIPKAMIESIADGFLDSVDDPNLRKAWQEFINSIFPDNTVTPEIKVNPKVNMGNSGSVTPIGLIASGNMSTFNRGGVSRITPNATEGEQTVKTTPANSSEEINNMATGVSRGNADVVSVLNQILSVARAISANNANNRRTYAPSSSTGALNAASAILLAKVTGNNP